MGLETMVAPSLQVAGAKCHPRGAPPGKRQASGVTERG